jgi:hypothetical protein
VAVVQRSPLERLRTGGHARPDPSSATRRLTRWFALLCVALVAGCGSDEKAASDLPATLGYMPRDAFAVALVPTDLKGEQLTRLHHLLRPEADLIGEDSDFRPLLGETLVIAASGSPEHPQVLAALESSNAAKFKGHEDIRVDGSTVLFDVQGHPAKAAVERHRAGDGMTADAFERAFGDGADDDALVRVIADGHTVAGLLDADVDVPWIKALGWASASIRLDDDAIEGHVRVSTDPAGLTDDDLPLAAGDDAPPAGDLDGAVNSANRDQSRTTVFLAGLARAAYPDSDFVREVERLEADTGIRFEDEVLRQFNGPSASAAWPDGSFGAVSEIADPDAMRALLPELAPRLPAILRGLRGLGDSGLVALLLMAPDAPLVPGALPLLDGIRVQRTNHGLYEITGLDEERRGGPEFAVPAVVFGMVGDRFVVATDESRAHQVATMDVSEVPDAHGAVVARADLSTFFTGGPIAQDTFPVRPVKLGRATGELEAATEGIEGRLRIEVPGGLD